MITVSEYLGFIFIEITKARQLADDASIKIAQHYARDGFLKYFAVPHFKIPELELSLPIVVSDVGFENIYQFQGKSADFVISLESRLNLLLNNIDNPDKLNNDIDYFLPGKMDDVGSKIRNMFDTVISATNGSDLTRINLMQQKIINSFFPDIFKTTLSVANLTNNYTNKYPDNKPFKDTLSWIVEEISKQTKILSSKLNSLLINPETLQVKEIGNEFATIRINAKIVEEGIFVDKVKDSNGNETSVVNFD